MGGESALYSSLRLTRQHARARIAALSASGNSSGDIMPIRAILFDKDGTFVDFDRTWGPAVGAVLQHLACGDDALYRKLCAVTGLVDGARFLPDSPFIDGPTSVFAGCWATVLGRPADAPFLKEIDYRLGLITNDAEATARAHARKLGLEPMLAFIAGYDSGFGAKPAPGPVLAFAAAIGVSTSEIVVVGDTALDVVTARAAGAKAVVVLSGPRSADDLQQAKADAVIASIAQLSAWLE